MGKSIISMAIFNSYFDIETEHFSLWKLLCFVTHLSRVFVLFRKIQKHGETNSLPWKIAIEIVDLPMKHGDFL